MSRTGSALILLARIACARRCDARDHEGRLSMRLDVQRPRTHGCRLGGRKQAGSVACVGCEVRWPVVRQTGVWDGSADLGIPGRRQGSEGRNEERAPPV